jgi:Ca-activated chloride channel homolog
MSFFPNLVKRSFRSRKSAFSLLTVCAAASTLAMNGLVSGYAASDPLTQTSSKEETSKIAFAGANSGALAVFGPKGKELGNCPLKHTSVSADVSGYLSRVTVKQLFANPFKEKIEAVYTFPLSETSAVDEMLMKVGKRTIHGTIKKREEAKQIYDAAKARGNVASLLDQERTNIFTQSVANIMPGEEVEITIHYVDLLPYEAGNYTFAFPTVVGPRFIPGKTALGKEGTGRVPDTDAVPDASKITPPIPPKGERAGHDIDISVSIDSGVPLKDIDSKVHEVDIQKTDATHAKISLKDKNTLPNKDFVLSWGVAADKLQSGYLAHRDGGSGYFTLMMLPPKRVTPEEISPKEMIFLIDCSGSQSGPPLDKAKETLHYIIDHMNPNDTFQILSFNNNVTKFAPKPLHVNAEMKKRANEFIDGLQANGGTWMAPAVEEACAIPADENRLRIVSFMTDGFVGNDFEIIGMIKKLRKNSRWFPFGTGSSVNRMLIDGIAREGGGEAEYVLLNSPGPVVGKKFYDRISTPVLTDIKLDFHGMPVKEVFPHDLADVWAEKPLYIKGRYTEPTAGSVTITGFAGGKPYKQDLKVNFPAQEKKNEVIASVWARAKVDRLMGEDWFGAQKGSVNPELKEEIIKTALDHHIMTQYTSFVAVEEKVVTEGGKAKTVTVPVEVPEGVDREMAYGDEEKISLHGYAPRSVNKAVHRLGSSGYMSLNAGTARGMGRGGGGGGAGIGASYYAPQKAQMLYGSGSAGKSGNIPPPPSVVPIYPGMMSPQMSPPPSSTATAGINVPQVVDGRVPGQPIARAAEESQKSGDKLAEKEKARDSKLDDSLRQLIALNEKKTQPEPTKQAEQSKEIKIVDGKAKVSITCKTAVSAALLKQLKGLGIEIVSTKGKVIVANVPIAALEKLSKLKDVVRVEPAK